MRTYVNFQSMIVRISKNRPNFFFKIQFAAGRVDNDQSAGRIKSQVAEEGLRSGLESDNNE